MQLPVRIQTTPGDEPVLSVDGAFGAPGLNLSHWPGNTTPPELVHDLSTGIALAFARLDASERERLTEGCTALVNNHYDTDGVCAMLAVRSPDFALEHESALLDAAATGDLFACPSEPAFALDRIVAGMADVQRSPIAPELLGLGDVERWERATQEMLERLPQLVGSDLDGELAKLEGLWRAELEALRADKHDLEGATFDDLVHLDYVLWTASSGVTSTRPGASIFDPGRHAFFGVTTADRVLLLGPGAEGTTCRFVIGTRSFFEPLRSRTQARPILADLAAHLNELEGTPPTDNVAWQHQEQDGASPELWFGTAGLRHFDEHASACLRPSGVDPVRLKEAVVDALRATWVFPEETEEELAEESA